MTIDRCPICDSVLAIAQPNSPVGDKTHLSCRACGMFTVIGMYDVIIERGYFNLNDEQKTKLVGMIKAANAKEKLLEVDVALLQSL